MGHLFHDGQERLMLPDVLNNSHCTLKVIFLVALLGYRLTLQMSEPILRRVK